MEKAKIGEYRLIPKGTKFWSINNQTTIMTLEDEIVEVANITTLGNTIFVKPKQLIFNRPGFVPTIIGRGIDEWGLSYSQTLPYEIPAPTLYE